MVADKAIAIGMPVPNGRADSDLKRFATVVARLDACKAVSSSICVRCAFRCCSTAFSR